jgi:acyl-CoA reductase-like NAD-dependent aldehyde dehydrogenase
MANIRLLHHAILRGGGPANLVSAVAEPTIASAQELMGHPGVRILAVTGGSGVVRQAMTSGKRAICAGPGNPPVVVDETADLELAGRGIVNGASFDNNIVCVDEKEVIAVSSIVDKLLDQMKRHGAYIVNERDFHKIERVIFSEQRGRRQRAVMEKDLIGKNAGEILTRAGISYSGDPPLLVVRVSNGHPLVWTEQMMPVLPVTAVPDVDSGIALAKEVEHGFGHSAGMYSRNIEALSHMARTINTSIFTKNGPFYAGLGEYRINRMPQKRKRHGALALLEFETIAAGVLASDLMVKRAPVAMLRCGTIHPGRFLILVGGSVASTEEAFLAGTQMGDAEQYLTGSVFLGDVHPAKHACHPLRDSARR